MSVDIDPIAALEEFIADEVIDEVVSLVRPGKEAVVYLVRKGGEPPQLFAAKVYREVIHRSFRDDTPYFAGIRFTEKSERERKAFEGRTRFGRKLRFGMWVARECSVLETLGRAGANVPALIAASGNVVLMGYVGDASCPAPALRNVKLARDEAAAAFETIVANIELFVECGIVHGDLSPFNILVWDGAVTVIDFPQAVNLLENPNAPELLVRDVQNVCDYFARAGVRASVREVVRRVRDVWPRSVRPPWC